MLSEFPNVENLHDRNRPFFVPTVRAAEAKDLPAILEILNREILEGVAHFGTEAMTLEALEKEFETRGSYPWIVALDDQKVVGFARASAWKSRGAYRQTCEVGVYVRPELHGRGIGRQIYDVFIPELLYRGFKTVLGGIALPNPSSIGLHERFGFHHIGTLPCVGWKNGAWHDVGYWALTFPHPND
jgi:L-amino acid N-acyltransferase YncA